MSLYIIAITDDAEAEFDQEIDYSIQKWGKRHALAHARTLRRLIKKIADAPFTSPLKEEWGKGLRARLYKGNWVACRVNETSKTIEIIGFPSVYRSICYSNTGTA